MQFFDQFTPGFAGVLFGLCVLAALLVIVAALHGPLIRLGLRLYYDIQQFFQSLEREGRHAREEERVRAAEMEEQESEESL